MTVISWNNRTKVLAAIEAHSPRGSAIRGNANSNVRGDNQLEITRSAAIDFAAPDLRAQLVSMRKAGWARNIVIVGAGPVVISRLSLPPVSADEMPGAVSMALESAGLAATDVRPAWQVLSRSKEAVQLLVAAWRSEGTDECLAAAAAGGFRICGVQHAAFALAAAANRLTTAENVWVAVLHDASCEFVYSGIEGVSHYRIMGADVGTEAADAQAGAADLSYWVGEIKRTVLAQGIQGVAGTPDVLGGRASANSSGLVFGSDRALVSQAVELLNSAGLRAKQGRIQTVVSSRIAARNDTVDEASGDASGLAALIGVALIASGKAAAGPDLLPACTAAAGVGNAANTSPGATGGRGRLRSVWRSRAFSIPLVAACLLGLGGLTFSMLRTAKAVRYGREWITQNAQRYATATQIIAEIGAAEEQADLLSALLVERRDYLDVLQGIAAVLPEGTQITSLVFKGDELVDLAGTAPQASRVLSALEECGVFADLRFRGSIVLLEQENYKTEQFHLSGTLLQAQRQRQVAP